MINISNRSGSICLIRGKKEMKLSSLMASLEWLPR